MASELMLLLQPHGPWSLRHARRAARHVVAYPREARALVRELFSHDATLRRHAADAARRVTEQEPTLLAPYVEQVLAALAESTGDDWRTLAHMGLLAARLAASRTHRLRAAGLLRPLLAHRSNVVRCTALEGLGLLASRMPELRLEVEPYLEDAATCGTPAMRCRARAALAKLR